MGDTNIEKELHYDAFISYRHCELDGFVAEKLHKALESYKLPGNVKRQIKKNDEKASTRISRVFRDEEELPLSSDLEGSIVKALGNSDWLIVICSPRLKESVWCRKEIETFISFHGRDHILAVLVEGEPSDSFPDEITFKEVITTKPDGTVEVTKKAIEPMAADVRGKDKKEVKANLKGELLRLCAPMFNLSYDQLKQRHREEKFKKNSFRASVIAIAAVIMFVVSFFVALTITQQASEIAEINADLQVKKTELEQKAQEIAQQNALLSRNQAETLAREALDNLKNGDREKALELAYASLTEYEGIEMPYTDEGRYAITQTLNPYKVDRDFVQTHKIVNNSMVMTVMASPNDKVLAMLDANYTFSFWSVSEFEPINSFKISKMVSNGAYTFINDDEFVIISGKTLYKYTISSGLEEEIASYDERYDGVTYDEANQRIILFSSDEIVFLDASSFEVIKSFEAVNLKCVNTQEGYSICYELEEFYVLDSNLKEILREKTYPYDFLYYKDECICDGMIYMLCSGENESEDENRIVGDLRSIIRAYSLENGNIKWEIKKDELWKKVEIAEDRIVIVKEAEIDVLDSETGEVVNVLVTNQAESIIWADSDNGKFRFFTNALTFGVVYNDSFLISANYLNYKSDTASEILLCAGKLLVRENGMNYVLCFENGNNTETVEYDGQCLFNLEYEVYDKYSSKVEELEIPDKEMMKYAVVDENREYMCVSYVTEAVIYKIDGFTEVLRIETDEKIQHYFGKDRDGNMYWGGTAESYCISPDNHLIAKISNLIGVNADTNQLVFKYIGTKYVLPVYSLDDLLKMSKEKLKK